MIQQSPPKPSLRQRLEILADAAKYDASCASSGTARKNSLGGKGIGSTEGMGICHAYAPDGRAYAPDGRCISLLKLLLTNHCIFDCHYCINRKSSNIARARFTPQEVADLTLNFYRRNYIEGLFLSSGIIKSADHTMEQLIETARILREEHDFRGYIHLKTIPEADAGLIHQAGLYADRVSINVELPTSGGLQRLAPDKNGGQRQRCRNRRQGEPALRRFWLEARLLQRLLADPRCKRRAALETPALAARTPAVSVGLAAALLWLWRGRCGERRRG